MYFEVRAVSRQNEVATLTIEAANEVDARRELDARSLRALSIKPRSEKLFARHRTRGRFSLLLFSQELLALLEAGLSIMESLEALLEKERHGETRTLVAALAQSLRQGKRLSAALQAHPDVFPGLYVGIVRAAERTSDLPQALGRYVDYRTRLEAVRTKVVSASIYPAILLVVGSAVSLFLLTYVVPRFAAVYEGTGRELPWLSTLLLSWGKFAATHTRWLIVGLIAASVGGFLGVRHFLAQGGIGRLLQPIPGIGERIKIYELSRLYLTLGMLLEGGIPIVGAMQMVRDFLSPDSRARLDIAARQVESGVNLSQAFDSAGLTTPVAVRMLRVGERSGQMGEMLARAARFYDGEITRWIDRFSKIFEPVLMAAIGIVVGLIVVLLYMPIFDLAGSLQ